MMTIFNVKELNPRAPFIDTLLEEDGDWKVVKFSVIVVLPDGQHRRNAIQMVKENGNLSWAEGLIFFHHIILQDGAGIQKAGATKPSKFMNKCTAILSKESSFVDIWKALLNYAGEIALQYGVIIIDSTITDILEDIMSTGYPTTCAGAAYVRFIQFVKIFMQKIHVLPALLRRSMERAKMFSFLLFIPTLCIEWCKHFLNGRSNGLLRQQADQMRPFHAFTL